MGNVSDHVSMCNEECQVRATEYVRSGQVHMERVMNEDRRRRLAASRSRDGSKGPQTSRDTARSRASARGSARSHGRSERSKVDDNPMREYRPVEASASSRRQDRDAKGACSSSTDAYVPPPSDEVVPSFDPWAPEGFNARRQREKARRKKNRDTEASRNADDGPRNEDTQIGAGISEFLRRGVAQAAPKPAAERPEMMPSKDGGFIATIQQGFQGIFGHLATSKEEVLKMRGPMSAVEYEAVPGDDLDQQVQSFARKIPEHLGEWLRIYRTARGEYEVSGEVVRMAWQSTVGPPTTEMPQGQIHREVFVFVESPDGNDVPGEPLHLYLRHSANVAYDLHFGSAMMKVPEQNRLSFDETGTLLKDSDADSKYKAMLLASEQAQKRERAALEFRKKMDDEAARGPVSPRDKAKIEKESAASPRKDPTSRSTTRNSFDDVLAYLPPLPPLLPPSLPGPGGSFLLPPSAGLDFLAQTSLNPFMPPPGPTLLQSRPNQPSPFKTPGSSTTAPPSGPGSTFPGGSFYNAGLAPNGGSFLGVGGSFLMTTGMQSSWGNLPRTGSNVQVGMQPISLG